MGEYWINSHPVDNKKKDKAIHWNICKDLTSGARVGRNKILKAIGCLISFLLSLLICDVILG